MKGMFLAMGALSILAAGGLGCRTVDEKRADYHEWRAQRAADKGNYDTARKQRDKAEKARENLPTDRLP